MSAFIEITDRHGRRRRARPGEVAKDGESVFFPPQFMDRAAACVPMSFMDTASTQRGGFVRGYAFADTMSVSHDARDEAAKAYDERSKRLHYTSRKVKDGDNARLSTQDAAQARALADGAWQEKKQRLQNAWRSR
jgi:hypothetical protein